MKNFLVESLEGAGVVMQSFLRYVLLLYIWQNCSPAGNSIGALDILLKHSVPL